MASRLRPRVCPTKNIQIFYGAASLLLIFYILYISVNNYSEKEQVGKKYPKSQRSSVLQEDNYFSRWKSLMFSKENTIIFSPSTIGTTTPPTKPSLTTTPSPATTTTEKLSTTKANIENTAEKPIFVNVTVIHKNLTVADFVKTNPNATNRITDKSKIGYPHQICGCGKYKPPDRGIQQKNLENITSSCSHEATQYGKGQKVRSYALFIHEDEDLPRYVLPIEDNMKAHSEIFPGWITRIYSNISTVNPIVCGLICKYDTLFWCDIKNIPEYGDLGNMHGRTWRFLPLGDPTVDIVLSRDMDNTVFTRERAAVAEWEASDLPFHSMRDNPGMSVVMLAGMWGAKNFMLGPVFSKFLQKTLIKAAKKNQHIENWDEEILKEHVHTPYASQMFLVHDSYYCKSFNDFKTLPFPTQRFEDQTVGEHYIKNVTKWTYPVPPCPVECRPEYGKNWEFC